MKYNIRYILIGLLLLFIGALVYLFDRPPDQTYFIFALPFQFSLYNIYPPLFGFIGGFLPHFLHTSAFILLTAGIMDCGKKGYLAICLFWLTINIGFELGQKYNAHAAGLVPDWFEGVFLLENTKGYFLHGTYCRLDMAAIIIGCVFAYIFLVYNHNKRGGHEYKSKTV